MSDKFDKLANSTIDSRKISYDGVKLTDNRKDMAFMGANMSYLAVVPDTDSASFYVWSLDSTQSKNSSGLKHKLSSTCLTIDFDPFYTSRVIIGCDSGKFYQWHIDMSKSVENADPVFEYEICPSSPIQALYHPTAGNVAFLVNAKNIACVNLTTCEVIRQTESEQEIVSASINVDGTKICCTYGDGKARIISTQDFSVLYVGDLDNKRTSVVYLTGLVGDYYCVSMKVNNRRTIKIYKAETDGQFTESKPATGDLASFSADVSTSTKKWAILYDPDTNVILLPTGGESTVYFAHLAENGELSEQGVIRCTSQPVTPVKSMIAGAKLSVNPLEKELIRLYKATSTCIEVHSFRHPRKATTFEKSLYPPTFSNEPAMTVEEFIEGKVAQPKMIDMEPLYQEYKKNAHLGRTLSVISGNNERLITSPMSFGSGSNISQASSSDVEELRRKVETLSTKVDMLTLRLDELESSKS